MLLLTRQILLVLCNIVLHQNVDDFLVLNGQKVVGDELQHKVVGLLYCLYSRFEGLLLPLVVLHHFEEDLCHPDATSFGQPHSQLYPSAARNSALSR